MWVHVLAVDEERMGERARELTVLTRHGRGYVACSMKMVDGHCVAMRPAAGSGGCSVYPIRPDICRVLAIQSAIRCASSVGVGTFRAEAAD